MPRLPPVPCVVCRAPILRVWYQNGIKRVCRSPRAQTCGSPECRAAIIIHNELCDSSRTLPREKHGNIRDLLSGVDVEFLAHHADGLLFVADDIVFDPVEDELLVYDERMADAPHVANYPWAKKSRISVMLRIVGEEAEASIRVRRVGHRSVRKVIKDAWGLSHEYLCDIFLAWRCPCPHDHQVMYKKLTDLPTRLGYHDACPRCGSAPLEVFS